MSRPAAGRQRQGRRALNLLPCAMLIHTTGFVAAHSTRTQLTSLTSLEAGLIGFFMHEEPAPLRALRRQGAPRPRLRGRIGAL